MFSWASQLFKLSLLVSSRCFVFVFVQNRIKYSGEEFKTEKEL